MTTPTPHHDRQWLTIAEFAERERIPLETARYWRSRGTAPRGYLLGRQVRFDLEDVIAWEEAQADDKRGL